MNHEVEFSDVVKEDNGYLLMCEKQTPDTLDRSTIQTPGIPGCTWGRITPDEALL